MGPFAEFGLICAGISKRLEHAKQEMLKEAAELIEKSAKEALGTHEFNWPPLSPETIARKATGDSPLLETGALRDSIEHTIGEGEAWVGTNDEKARFLEFGTSRMPPRPFLMGAVNARHDELEKIFNGKIEAALKLKP